MPRTIEVSDETYNRLSRFVNPLFDMDAVIAALLGRAAGTDAPASRLEPQPTPAGPAPHSVPVPAPRPASPTASSAPVRRVVVSRAARGESTDRDVYMRHILAELARAGGKSLVDDMRRALEQRLVPLLKPMDLLRLPNTKPNEPRWWNHARFARQRLVDHGLLRSDSPHGTWELSEDGWRMARSLLRNVNDRTIRMP